MKRAAIVLLACGLVAGAEAQENLNKAKAALVSRDTTTALNYLQHALKAGERLAETNWLLGSIALNRKEYKTALPYLEAAERLDDENIEAGIGLAVAQLELKDPQASLKTFRHIEKQTRKNGAALKVHGKAYLAADSVDAAIRTLTLAKEYDAGNPEISVLLGDAYLKQNVPPLALLHYQKTVELNPRDVETRLKMARIYEKQQNYSEAVKQYDAIIDVDSTMADAHYAKGNILVRAKQYQRAVAPLKKYTQMRPKSADGAAYYARALYGAENFPEAAKESERAVKLDSTNNDLWRIRAESQLELKDYAGAIASYQVLKRRAAFKPEDQAKYGNALVGGGKEEEALQALLAAVKEDSTNCDPYYNLGSLYMKKQEWVNAAAMFEKKIGCDPRSLGAYLNASACYYQPTVKNYPRMRELLMKALELKPDWNLARLWLGRYYTAVDSLPLAKDQYDEVLKAIGPNPDKRNKDLAGEAEYMIGQYYFTLQQYQRSLESCRRAYNIGYDNLSLRMTWGQAALQTLDPKGDPAENKRKVEEATKQFRRATEMEPNAAGAHLWLAQCLVLSRVEGDNEGNQKLKEEACSEYRKVLRIEPRNEDAKKGMERIGCPGAAK